MKKKPQLVRTNIYLARRQVKALDKIAEYEGLSRSEIIRRMIDIGLAVKTERET